jgi:hypothetical protein
MTSDTMTRLRSDALEWRSVDGQIVALDLRTSEYLSVNAAGAALWPGLAAGATREQLVATLADRFSLPEDAAGRDVDTFVASLRAQDLLEQR